MSENALELWSKRIDALTGEAKTQIAVISGLETLESCRLHFLGKKGVLTELMKELGKFPADQKAEAGKLVNIAKQTVENLLQTAKAGFEEKEKEKRLASEKIDVTLPGWVYAYGHQHPITQVTKEIIEAFVQIGFTVHEGTEIETDYYNFEALNIPKDHPARDMQDTLYVSNELLLRTHTSPIQIHVMQNEKPPLRVIAPGRVYRADEVDVSHSPMFHQIEGFLVDDNVSFAQLKYVLVYFAKRLFGEKAKLRFRPSFFPFTEPSAEVDVSCSVCDAAGCRLCSGRGWLEVLGAGMIHPKVFESVGYDPEKTTGFAFGMGVERIAMLKYGIHDIRLFYENDARFLRQF